MNCRSIELDSLSLSKEEAAILTLIQNRYKLYELYKDHTPERLNLEKIHNIRGMKYAFDKIISTDDGYLQSLDWQAVLY